MIRPPAAYVIVAGSGKREKGAVSVFLEAPYREPRRRGHCESGERKRKGGRDFHKTHPSPNPCRAETLIPTG